MKRKYSPSGVKTYDSCNYKYFLSYIKDIWPPESDEIDYYTAFGYIVHEIAELYNGMNAREVSLKVVKKYKQYLNDEFRLAIPKTIKNLFKWINKNVNEHTLKEYRLELKEDDLWVGGIIDDLMPDRKMFTDYKSGYPNKDRHIFQMKLYASILYKKWKCEPKDIKCILYYPKVNTQDFILFTNEEIYQFEKDLKDKIREIENRDIWKPTPGFHCRWCNYPEMGLCKFGERND